jgi:hypothetical protein
MKDFEEKKTYILNNFRNNPCLDAMSSNSKQVFSTKYRYQSYFSLQFHLLKYLNEYNCQCFIVLKSD